MFSAVCLWLHLVHLSRCLGRCHFVHFEEELGQVVLLKLGALAANASHFERERGELERLLEAHLARHPVVVLKIEMTCLQIVADRCEPRTKFE